MENVTQEDIEKAADLMNEKINETIELLSATTGMSKEAMIEQFTQELPSFIEELKKEQTTYYLR